MRSSICGPSDGGKEQCLNKAGQLPCTIYPNLCLMGKTRECVVINGVLESASVARTLGGQQPGPPGELMVFRSSLGGSLAVVETKLNLTRPLCPARLAEVLLKGA